MTTKSINAKQFEALQEISTLLTSQHSLDDVLEAIIAKIPKVLGISLVSTLLWNKPKRTLIVSKTSVPKRILTISEKALNTRLEGIEYPTGDKPNIFIKSIESKSIQITKDIKSSLVPIMAPRYAGLIATLAKAGMKQLISAPLIVNKEVIGVFALGWKKSTFTKADETIIQTFANQAAIALANARYIDQLEHQKKELKEALRKERDMIDILSHELRTPLSTSRNAIYMLYSLNEREKLAKSSLDQYLPLLKRNINKEIGLLETLLSTTHLDKKGLNLRKESVDLHEIIQETIEAYSQDAADKKLELIYKGKKSVIIDSDKVRIQEIISNLISNAIKYTNKGYVKVKIKENRKTVNVDIKDSGIGIPKKEIPNICKKFYRVNTHINGQGKSLKIVRPGGTGLGLYVTSGLIKALDGSLGIESEEGKGSKFSITLPKGS